MLMRSPLARERRRPAGFIKPFQPTLSDTVPSGPLWLHEIKHDGYRILARKEGDRVRLWSRNGRDWSREFTAIAEALRGLPDCVIDGEACAHCEEGWPDFWQLRGGGSPVLLRLCPADVGWRGLEAAPAARAQDRTEAPPRQAKPRSAAEGEGFGPRPLSYAPVRVRCLARSSHPGGRLSQAQPFSR
jgi:hypothetical protein